MPSPARRPTPHSAIATVLSITTSVMASIVTPASAGAQQTSAQTSVAITVRVQPLLAIRGIALAPARLAGSRERGDAVSVVDVESNLPYRVAVRLAPAAAARGERVSVRAASGAFEPIGSTASVVLADSRTPGRRAHEVHCRVDEAPAEAVEASRCALVYELSAEHHDSLLRTTAAAASPVVAVPTTHTAAALVAGR